MKKESHNGIISFWKFMFSILICCFHLGTLFKSTRYNFSAGSIGVEFFFLVSGYLFCKKCLKYEKTTNEGIFEDNIKMAWNKIKRFFPYVLFLVIISVVFARVVLNYRFLDFIYSLYNVMLIPAKKAIISLPYGVLWYISVLIIVQFMIFPIFVKNKHKYSLYIAPIIAFLLCGYLLIEHGCLVKPWAKDIFTYKSVVRGIMEINLGIFLYELCERFKKIDFNKFARAILTIIEVIGYVGIFVLCNKVNAHIKYDALMLIIFSICILISFSNKSLFNNIMNNKLSYYLEKISLPMYINNWFMVLFTQFLIHKFNYNFNYYLSLLTTVILLIILAIIETFIIDKYEKGKYKISNIFINKK